MKVLIITYYWPPAGGSGVQRWLKFVKYLPDFNIEPIVFIPDHPNYALIDTSLENEIPQSVKILKQSIWEPNNLLSKLKSKQQQSSAGFLSPDPSFFEKKLRYIRANYFIPDARKFWIKPSVKHLSNYLKNNKVDAIITTGPPHSLHLIGLKLKQNTGLKWIADFRDPWTDIDYFHQLPLTERSQKKHKDLEKKVLQNADSITVIGKTMKEKFKVFNRNIHVITNGFDTVTGTNSSKPDKEFTITHIGLMNADRNPKSFWKVLGELKQENMNFASDLKVKLIGEVAKEVRQSVLENNLQDQVQFISYLPHAKVVYHQKNTQVLLLAANNVPAAKGIITGKIFEYLQAGRPILAIAPKDGDLAEIIENTSSGEVINFDEELQLKKIILEYYKKYQQGNLNITSKNIDQYHRKNLTRQLAELIKKLT